MKCDKCGFNATVEQLHSVRLEERLTKIKNWIKCMNPKHCLSWACWMQPLRGAGYEKIFSIPLRGDYPRVCRGHNGFPDEQLACQPWFTTDSVCSLSVPVSPVHKHTEEQETTDQ